MTKLKKMIVAGAVVLAIGATSSTVLAASNYTNPAEALAGITGKSLSSVLNESFETGKSFGMIADEAGKLDEYHKELVEMNKDVLTKKVEAGALTQQQADQIITNIEKNEANYNGYGYGRGRGMMGGSYGMMGGGYGGMYGSGGCGWGGFGYNQSR